MDIGKQKLSIRGAKEIDLVDYLSRLGHEPSKIRNSDYWYLSPLRNEKTPSFKVNRKLNCWYDHGMGKGGNLIDFAILYHHCTIREFLEQINHDFSCHPPVQNRFKESLPQGNKIHVFRESTLTSRSLIHYLHRRRIPFYIAEKYCREVGYELHDNTYYAIGFKNDAGGYEIRNPYFKGSSSPKDITTLKNGAKEVIVFEGFMDFLSFKAIHQPEPENRFDFVILNSVSLFERARLFMEEHDAVMLYLDRDTAGQNCSHYALSLGQKYKDESELYRNHKDLNDWLMNFGKSQNQHFRQSLK